MALFLGVLGHEGRRYSTKQGLLLSADFAHADPQTFTGIKINHRQQMLLTFVDKASETKSISQA